MTSHDRHLYREPMAQQTVKEGDKKDRGRPRTQTPQQGGGAIYGLGLIGALVWFWQQAEDGGEHAGECSRRLCGRRSWSIRLSGH